MCLFISSTAGADKDAPAKKVRASIAACATFHQKDASETTVEMTVDNACTIAVQCTVTWSVTCAPDSKHRSKKFEGASFTLASAEAKTTTASADRCGNDGWAIDDVSWSCAPTKD